MGRQRLSCAWVRDQEVTYFSFLRSGRPQLHVCKRGPRGLKGRGRQAIVSLTNFQSPSHLNRSLLKNAHTQRGRFWDKSGIGSKQKDWPEENKDLKDKPLINDLNFTKAWLWAHLSMCVHVFYFSNKHLISSLSSVSLSDFFPKWAVTGAQTLATGSCKIVVRIWHSYWPWPGFDPWSAISLQGAASCCLLDINSISTFSFSNHWLGIPLIKSNLHTHWPQFYPVVLYSLFCCLKILQICPTYSQCLW